MRRKQTTLVTTAVLIAGLMLLSQMPSVSQVDNANPLKTNQEPPPVSDSDGDGIPDVHENTYSEWVNWTTSDAREVTIRGMDRMDASDAPEDFDNDGLNNTEEYCWPYRWNCTIDAKGLTGVLDTDTGDRVHLDPRRADSDGDGLPDGFEVYLCVTARNAYSAENNLYTCSDGFDPLNSSDGALDADRDGFDVDRDGIYEPHEWFNNTEEYSMGAGDNWTTELDGLRCSFTPPEGPTSNDDGEWPYLTMSWPNINEACTENETAAYGEDVWLGTNPSEADSDRFWYDGFTVNEYSGSGDGLPDGWEVFFGMDPLNRSDRLEDPDLDGWDLDKDGFTSKDVSGKEEDLAAGEEFSNLEEYNVFLDDENWVLAGLKSVMKGSTEGSLEQVPMSRSSSAMGTYSVLHHDVKKLIEIDNQTFIACTRLGFSTIMLDEDRSQDDWLPTGWELNDAELVSGDTDVLVVATNKGVIVVPLDGDSDTPAAISTWDIMEGDSYTTVTILQQDGSDSHALLLGLDGGSIIRISGFDGTVIDVDDISVELHQAIFDASATPTDAIHVEHSGRSRLFVGTSEGMLEAAVSSGAEGWEFTSPLWHFSAVDDDHLREVSALAPKNTNAEYVNTIISDGPIGSDPVVLWFGTNSGLHKFNLEKDTIQHSGLQAHPTDIDQNPKDLANAVTSILSADGKLMIGSKSGMWSLQGSYAAIQGFTLQERIPGHINDMLLMTVDDEVKIFAGCDPGRFSNIALIDPGSNDSDFDGIPDGWEYIYGLDPTDPWDAELDLDGDGVNMDHEQDPMNERNWTNLLEYRYSPISSGGSNSTDPRDVDTDDDGLPDGTEAFGFYYSQTNLWCHYHPNMTYDCSEEAVGASANSTYLDGLHSDQLLDPTNQDSDGDGMPDGWEIEHRRWIGSSYSGGNNWTLDPLRFDDRYWDADGDGMPNLCEYNWESYVQDGLDGKLFDTHFETPEAAAEWVTTDPNNPDSDGDGLPDGWEALYQCLWDASAVGISPLNGSDAYNNPDGDGFDMNYDGVLDIDEQFVNYLEFHIKDTLFSGNQTTEGIELPENFTTSLFTNMSDWGVPESAFGDHVSTTITVGQPNKHHGSSDPLDADTDGDGMPDGWEIHYARWDILADNWILNPVNNSDLGGDPDKDGMANWEEYNAIDPLLTETNANKSAPQWFVLKTGNISLLQEWSSAVSSESFGSFITPEQIARRGWTADPTDPDTDGDGFVDGAEQLFTNWNTSTETWTLNPLVAGDGQFDSDNDGLTDAQELGIASSQPNNGLNHPADAWLFHEDAFFQEPLGLGTRISYMLLSKELRGGLAFEQMQNFMVTSQTTPLLNMLMSITDPSNNDTDGDEMSDGFEYWFTKWDLSLNRWSMNPLSTTDTELDSDDDSWDCDEDGSISENETFTNLREWQSLVYGRYDRRMGNSGFGHDAVAALVGENGLSESAARLQLYNTWSTRDQESSDRMVEINLVDPDNWNRSLFGVSDPTSADSDGDLIPDGWEYCYAALNMTGMSSPLRWSANPVNPADADYDGDRDGWYDRDGFDIPAAQGTWANREFTQSGLQISPGPGDLPFTNLMEYMNNTRPDLTDSDGDCVVMNRTASGVDSQVTLAYEIDLNLSDGREVFKYGMNPKDNDSDHDFLPDWYEYYYGWNNDDSNWSTLLSVEVQWEDWGSSKKPLRYNMATDEVERPNLNQVWVTFNPADPSDANHDYDKDGDWDCSATCVYTPYTNFQEFFMITNSTLLSPNAVLMAGLTYHGSNVTEWWQLREFLLDTKSANPSASNYLRMNKMPDDNIYSLRIDDQDTNFLIVDDTDDVLLCDGSTTDDWEIAFPLSPDSPPVLNFGEWEYGWWHFDIDGDHTADGSNPLNWDSDGDWTVDWFEVEDDEQDGVRGDGSPLRYDVREP